MTSIRATIHDRRIDVPAPDDLPDGTEVVIELQPIDNAYAPESLRAASNVGIARWLDWLDSLEPLLLSDQDFAAIKADRETRLKWEQEQFATHGDRLAKEWESSVCSSIPMRSLHRIRSR